MCGSLLVAINQQQGSHPPPPMLNRTQSFSVGHVVAPKLKLKSSLKSSPRRKPLQSKPNIRFSVVTEFNAQTQESNVIGDLECVSPRLDKQSKNSFSHRGVIAAKNTLRRTASNRSTNSKTQNAKPPNTGRGSDGTISDAGSDKSTGSHLSEKSSASNRSSNRSSPNSIVESLERRLSKNSSLRDDILDIKNKSDIRAAASSFKASILSESEEGDTSVFAYFIPSSDAGNAGNEGPTDSSFSISSLVNSLTGSTTSLVDSSTGLPQEYYCFQLFSSPAPVKSPARQSEPSSALLSPQQQTSRKEMKRWISSVVGGGLVS